MCKAMVFGIVFGRPPFEACCWKQEVGKTDFFPLLISDFYLLLRPDIFVGC